MDPSFRHGKKKVGLGIVTGYGDAQGINIATRYVERRRECQTVYATGHGQLGIEGVERSFSVTARTWPWTTRGFGIDSSIKLNMPGTERVFSDRA